ncbi:MAG TPA: hypothetical protein VF506_10435 [Streptosporangiaceae bacterium]
MTGRPQAGSAGPRLLGVLATAVFAAAVFAVALTACATSGPVGSGQRAIARSAPVSPKQAGSHSPAKTTAGTTAAGDTPPGFWYGTDSAAMPVTGTGPYTEPVIGGNYGGYMGMAGNWAHWQGCRGKLVWSATNANQASANLSTYSKGVGTGVYWFMAGPGVDPNYNGTVSEATTWGQQQAARTLADIGTGVQYPVVWMDVELPGNAPQYTPAPDNGWKNVYTSPCSGTVKTQHISAAVDRAVLDGYAAYLTGHSSYKAGVYSAPPAWRAIFGTGSAAQIPSLYEWTYTAASASLAHHPSAWCLKGTTTCAQFFGGQHATNATALMWQWSGGGGVRNAYGDFDQIDGARTP